MPKQKLKDKKKKERAKKVQAKLQRRRDYMTQERLKREEEMVRERTAYELEHGRPMPIITDPAKLAIVQARKQQAINDKLKKNLEILEALEAAYDEEHARRAEVHERLESEGHMSIKDKMAALHQKALEMQGLANKLTEAQEEYAAQQAETVPAEKSEN